MSLSQWEPLCVGPANTAPLHGAVGVCGVYGARSFFLPARPEEGGAAVSAGSPEPSPTERGVGEPPGEEGLEGKLLLVWSGE